MGSAFRLWIGALSLLAALIGAFVWSLIDDHRRTLDNEFRNLGNLARIGDERLSGSLRAVELLLGNLADDINEPTPPSDEVLTGRMTMALKNFPEIRTIFRVDATGIIIQGTRPDIIGIDVSSRDYFKDLFAQKDRTRIHISKPTIARPTNATVVYAVRGLSLSPDGWSGLIGVTLELKYIQDHLETIRPTGDGTALLVTATGDILGRAPFAENLIGKSIQTGGHFEQHKKRGEKVSHHRMIAVTDKKERIGAIRDTPNGVTVIVSRTSEDVFAPWRRQTLLQIVVFAVLCLGIVTLTAAIARRQGRLQQERDHLEDEVSKRTDTLAQEIALRRQLSRAVEQSPNMVFITDINGIIEYVNPRFTQFTGYSAEDAIGKTPRILSSGETPKQIYRDLWTTITAGREWRAELKDRRKDGSDFWANVTIAPVKDDHGTIRHFVSVHEDITERKLAETEIHQAKNQAEVANRAKSELLANMSHELRTPLNAIIGFSEALLTETFGPLGSDKNREYVGDIRFSGEHLLELINDVLDMSAIEAGMLTLHEENVDIEEAADACIRLIRPRAEKGQVEIGLALEPGLPMIYVDRRRLKQIILNLLSNAVKFTEPGGRVSLKATAAPDGGMLVSVQDTGIGMTEDELAKALTAFGQVEGSLARKHEGTGLGLPLTVNLVELHGGRIDFHSAKGQGTTITLTLPPSRVRAAEERGG